MYNIGTKWQKCVGNQKGDFAIENTTIEQNITNENDNKVLNFFVAKPRTTQKPVNRSA